MSIPGSASPLFLSAAAAAAPAGFQIDRSLRFNSGDTSYLDRTPSSTGNRKTLTWSGWVKKCALGTVNTLFAAGSGIWAGGAQTVLAIYSDDAIWFFDYNGSGYTHRKITTQLFRDPSAWYHIVAAVDTTAAAESDRVKLYVNGEIITDFSTNASPSQNYTLYVNNTVAHYISLNTASGLDGYLADVHFIDGQALAPTDFGEYDSNNVWQPKAYSGTYGTNGFYLKFADNSSNAALGTDSSGNNNTWTVNNLTGPAESYPEGSASIPGGSPAEGTAYANLWNGAYSSYPGDFLTAADGKVIRIDWSSGISGVTKIRYYSYNGDDRHNVNSGGWSSNSGSGQGWKTAYSGSAITLTRLELQKADGASYVKIGAIEINDQLVPYTATTDSLIDTPTNYEADSGNNGGNYATLNPLSKGGQITLSNGNLDWVASSTTPAWETRYSFSSIGVSSGKWYVESTITNIGTSQTYVGIITTENASNLTSTSLGFQTTGWGYYVNGNIYNNGSIIDSTPASYTTGDVIGIALDVDSRTVAFYKNGVQQGSTATSLTADKAWFFVADSFSSAGQSWNFGARPFAYTPPTNHLSLCTTNLPDPTIADGSTAFDVALWTGNGTSQTISGLNFSPDLVWNKSRSTTRQNHLVDTVRGTGKRLFSDSTEVENSASTNLTAFNSDGFDLGSSADVNQNGTTFVGWTWDAGTSTVSNTDGSITSSVRANQSAGFSIVSYTGNATNNATIGHGLNAVPEFAIFKDRDTTRGWAIYHKDVDPKVLNFDSAAAITSQEQFNETTPTSSVFTLGSGGRTNQNGSNVICYAFTSVSQYSAMGSYTGNGSADGPFVYTGFKVAFLILKQTDATGNWSMYDAGRDNRQPLYPNLSNSEGTLQAVSFLSNGFKLDRPEAFVNASSGTYVYLAFAEHPFKTSRAK